MIDFSAVACFFEIRVNDYPVITQNIEGQVASMIPINQAILESGNATITATVLPIAGTTELHPGAYLRFKIMLFDVTNDFVFQEQYEQYETDPVGDQKLPTMALAGNFMVNVPYIQDAWQDGRNLMDVEDLAPKLHSAYKNISSIINEKNYEQFKQLIARRENNIAKAMYLSSVEARSRAEDVITDMRSGFTLMPIPKDAILQLYANNKVAALKKLNGESALYLFNKKTNEELMLDLTFYIPEGKTEFEVI